MCALATLYYFRVAEQIVQKTAEMLHHASSTRVSFLLLSRLIKPSTGFFVVLAGLAQSCRIRMVLNLILTHKVGRTSHRKSDSPIPSTRSCFHLCVSKWVGSYRLFLYCPHIFAQRREATTSSSSSPRRPIIFTQLRTKDLRWTLCHHGDHNQSTRDQRRTNSTSQAVMVGVATLVWFL